jgi:hypothetical protein
VTSAAALPVFLAGTTRARIVPPVLRIFAAPKDYRGGISNSLVEMFNELRVVDLRESFEGRLCEQITLK